MKKRFLILSTMLMLFASISAQVVVNGVPWFDNNGKPVNAHGACIVYENDKYYLFGEWKSDTTNAFPGFSCYSSDNLSDWKFENIVLPMQKDGILGPNRVGERVKVMRCPSTGEYIMLMHCDNLGYKDPYIGLATSETIDGVYTFQGPLLYNGNPIKRWDMGTFQDDDGSGYLLIHHGPIYKLSDDYKSVVSEVAYVNESGESPAMFKKDGTYFLLYSNLTSWEKNDNFYFSAPSIKGPWTKHGCFCGEGNLTYNSQTTFVFNLKTKSGYIPMFMGDRWSYPHQASAATYVWLPLEVNGTEVSIPEYWNAWNIENVEAVDVLAGGKDIAYKKMTVSSYDDWKAYNGILRSNKLGSTISADFNGGRIAVVGETNRHSAYAEISIVNRKTGQTMYSQLVDFYSLKSDNGVRFISPEMPKGKYYIEVKVTGDRPNWTDKTKTIYGTDGDFVNIEKFVVLKND